jgi:hypothetical protein
MVPDKITPSLAARLDQASMAEVVDIVVELQPAVEPVATAQARSRADKISAAKDAFSHAVSPVEEVIHNVGGEITGRAWINQTVRARVPIEGVGQLSDLDKVASLDTAHPLRTDHG